MAVIAESGMAGSERPSIQADFQKSVDAASTADTDKVAAEMRALPINDFMIHGGSIRADGRVIHDKYSLQAKAPNEFNGEWDLLNVVRTIPASEAFRPLELNECPVAHVGKADTVK